MKIIRKFIEAMKETFFPNKKKDISLGGWLLGIGEKDTDYKFGANIYDTLKNVKNLNRKPYIMYNQWAQYKTRNWCTIYSAMTELSYLFDYKFTLCQIEEIWDLMIKEWKLDPDNGAYLSDAVDYVRRWWNEKFPEQPIISYQINYNDDITQKALIENMRMTQIGYRTSSELYNEIQTRGYALLKNYPKVGGHAVSSWGGNIIDNYINENKINWYFFQYRKDLIKNGVIFPNGYIFLEKE